MGDMDVVSSIRFLDDAIDSQRTALRFHLILATGVIIAGLCAIVLTHLLTGSVIPENLKWLLTLGGGFLSTLSSFPLRDIFSRRDKVHALVFLRQELQRLQDAATPADPQQLERLQQRFWQFIDKCLGT